VSDIYFLAKFENNLYAGLILTQLNSVYEIYTTNYRLKTEINQTHLKYG